MPPLDRRTVIQRGPRFWFDGDNLMFENVIDGSTREGPRIATAADRGAHELAYAAAMGEKSDVFPGERLISARDPETIPAPAPKPLAARRNATLRE